MLPVTSTNNTVFWNYGRTVTTFAVLWYVFRSLVSCKLQPPLLLCLSFLVTGLTTVVGLRSLNDAWSLLQQRYHQPSSSWSQQPLASATIVKGPDHRPEGSLSPFPFETKNGITFLPSLGSEILISLSKFFYQLLENIIGEKKCIIFTCWFVQSKEQPADQFVKAMIDC